MSINIGAIKKEDFLAKILSQKKIWQSAPFQHPDTQDNLKKLLKDESLIKRTHGNTLNEMHDTAKVLSEKKSKTAHALKIAACVTGGIAAISIPFLLKTIAFMPLAMDNEDAFNSLMSQAETITTVFNVMGASAIGLGITAAIKHFKAKKHMKTQNAVEYWGNKLYGIENIKQT